MLSIDYNVLLLLLVSFKLLKFEAKQNETHYYCFSLGGSLPMQHTVSTETLFIKNIRGNNPLTDFLKTSPIDQILSLFANSFQSIFSAGMVCR